MQGWLWWVELDKTRQHSRSQLTNKFRYQEAVGGPDGLARLTQMEAWGQIRVSCTGLVKVTCGPIFEVL